jgi:predicted transcriptional regulator YdeE
MDSCRAGIKAITPQLVQRQEVLVMGMEVRTTDQREIDPVAAEIPKLWNRFLAEQLWLDISECVHPQVFYGIYTDYAGQESEFSAIVAVEVSSIDNPPENMVGIALAAGDYLVFNASNSSPEAVRQTWQQVWDYFLLGCRYQRAFATDFELHDESGQVRIYVSIK